MALPVDTSLKHNGGPTNLDQATILTPNATGSIVLPLDVSCIPPQSQRGMTAIPIAQLQPVDSKTGTAYNEKPVRPRIGGNFKL